jgi:hypothetical protein
LPYIRFPPYDIPVITLCVVVVSVGTVPTSVTFGTEKAVPRDVFVAVTSVIVTALAVAVEPAVTAPTAVIASVKVKTPFATVPITLEVELA